MYHIRVSLPGGKLEQIPVGHDRKNAERELTATKAAKDKGEYRPIKDKTFEVWADEWLAGLRRPKESTKKSYGPTLAYAKQAFGKKKVRALDVVRR